MSVMSEETQQFVRAQRLGYIATISPDGFPNLSPKGSLTVWDGDHLAFADVESPHTIRNLGDNPNLEVNVVDPFLRKGFRFRGKGTVLRSGADYWAVVERYKSEGADIRRIRAIVLIEVLHSYPLISPVYTTGLTEAEVRRLWEEYHVKSIQKTVTDLIPPNDF
jgi:predicted pyridoxine 5'-phosphate oxidase superfamily flavin-nucleotide-binding protein